MLPPPARQGFGSRNVMGERPPLYSAAMTGRLAARFGAPCGAALLFLVLPALTLEGRSAQQRGEGATAPQNQSDDEYTRYELLDPSTASFRIIYDVTATTPGARF